MKLGKIDEALRSGGPFLTVYMDVSRDVTPAAHELEVGWRSTAEELMSQGAPAGLVERVGERMTEPTRWPAPVGRIIVAAGETIVLDRIQAAVPSREVVAWGPLPDVTSWLVDADGCRSLLLVLADRLGADLELYDSWPGQPSGHTTVNGEDLHLTKIPAGDWAHKEYQRRTEEVWRRNARRVADLIDRNARDGIDLIALAGDVRACGEIRDAVSAPAHERLVEVKHGSRAPGSSRASLDADLHDVLRDHVVAERLSLVREVEQRRGRDEAIAMGIPDALDSLVNGQADRVLLAPEVAAAHTVRPSRYPGLPLPQPALDADELRADLVLVGAAAATDAEVVVTAPQALPDDGVTALLRWD